MKLALKWLTPILVRLLSLSHVSLAHTAAVSNNPASVHLVTGFYIGLATNPQPRADLSLDKATFIQLAGHELAVPIMPLHLLGKKSWNVYNQDNIAKVKRDEAAAKAKEEAEEERMQEIDAERRIQILRGERPAPLPIGDDSQNEPEEGKRSYASGRERKKRKRVGEDDTDFELRVARDQKKSVNSETQVVLRKPTVDAPLTDRAGHINLFPQEPSQMRVEKNSEAEKEAARKKKEYEDQFTMRFSNAAGFKQGLDNPWYSRHGTGNSTVAEEIGPSSKDVWGNEDPRRKEREVARMSTNDPLAAMRKGAAQVRQVEKERKRWQEERDKEMVEMLKAEHERQERKKRKRTHDGDPSDDLEGFSLDKYKRSTSRHDGEERRSRHRESHRRSHRDGSQDRDRRRHRHRH